MLTLTMIVKNEERSLEDCLKSVGGVVNEIVVVDTGSTDRTIEIAESYKAKIFKFNWVNDFSAARNYALEKSSGDWILYLDADERLSPDSIPELKRLTEREEREAYFCTIYNTGNINRIPSIWMYVRLFPNNKKIRFEGAVHEQIEQSIKKENFRISQSNIKIIHTGYDLDKKQLKQKAERNLKILLNEYKKSMSSYYAYQIGQTYGVLENGKSAIEYFSIAIKDEKLPNEYKSIAYRYLAVKQAERYNFLEAYNLINCSLSYDDEQPSALMAASKISLKLNKHNEAESLCLKALKANREFSSGSRKSLQKALLDEKTIIYEGMKIGITLNNRNYFDKFLEALKHLTNEYIPPDELKMFDALINDVMINQEEVSKYTFNVTDSNIEVILLLLQRYKNEESKLVIYESLYKQLPGNSLLLNNFGLFLSGRKQFTRAEEILEESFKIDSNNPSTVFYLISVYINNSNFQKIKPVLAKAEADFVDQPEVIEKIQTLKKKLISSLSNIF